MQVLKESGSTPEALEMVEKIKQQLAQFDVADQENSDSFRARVISDNPSFSKRSKARLVASAKVANHKDVPVRDFSMEKDLKSKTASKSKTLLNLKTSVAEQQMVKSVNFTRTEP